MTAIMGIKDGKRYIVGVDSISSSPSYRQKTTCLDNFKVRPIDGSPNCLIAASGACLNNDIIRNIPNLLSGKKDVDFSYIVKHVIPKMVSSLDEANLMKVDSDGDRYLDGSYLIATKKHMFEINRYGNLIEADSLCLLGSGQNLLYCKYLELKDKNISKEDLVIECLKHAIKYGDSIGYPIVLMDTEGMQKIIEE